MKKCILFLVAIMPLMCCGQTEVATVFQNNMNTIFQSVDRTPVTTGLLQDYGLLMTDVDAFNGTLQTNNYVDRSVWSTLYTSLYNMRFNANATLPAISTVNTAIDNYIASDGATVSLMALHYQYEQFKLDAATSNLVYVQNGIIYDTPGRPSSPYEIKNAFAFAPTKTNLSGGSQTFLLRSDLFYKNVNKTVNSIQMDCGDGLGFRNISVGTPLSANYSIEGAKDLILKIMYADGQMLQSRARINIKGIQQGCPTCRYSAPITEFFPKGNFPVPASQMGFSFATIATAGTDGILDKPLILVEGFDPENNFGYENYLRSNALGVTIDRDFGGQTLAQALEANNYDLIFLDYGNGGDDIKRNAYLLENVIQWVNQQTAAVGSTQKNVVIGVSMGGIVARYALRDMELRNANHNTRLYASIDSPHQGANVPLGFQAAVKFLGGLSFFGISLTGSNPQLQRGLASLNSPAATQMLTYQLSGQGSSLAFTNTSSVNFYNEYKTIGMPRLWGIRNIAVANGSECAQNQGYNPNSLMLGANGSYNVSYLINLLTGPLQTLTIDPFALFSGFFTTRSDVKIDMSVRSLPDQQVQPIFYMRVYYRKEILWGLITSTSDLINYTYNSPANLLPLDGNPGGVFDISNFAPIPSNISILNLNPAITRFNFIPTTSSLDIGSGQQPIVQADYLRAYSPAVPPSAPKNVPFNNFYSNPLSNEVHPQLTTKNANWLFSELQGTPQVFSCNYLCPSTTGIAPVISGASIVCSTPVTFTLSNMPPVSTFTWSNSSNLTYVSGQSTFNYTVSANSIGAGSVTITPAGQCGAGAPITKSVSVATGGQPTFLNMGRDDCFDQRFNTDFAGGATVYDWTIINFSNNSSTFYPQRNYQLITGLGAGNYRVVVGSTCPSVLAQSLDFTVVCSGGGGNRFAISPNPTSSLLNISSLSAGDANTESETSTKNFEVRLTDDSGNEVLKGHSEGGAIDLDVKNLKKGYYILQIIQAKELSAHRILIQ